MVTKEKATVKIIKDFKFAESYNSEYRAVVSKRIDEKYARKLIQDHLKDHGVYGATINKLYKSHNGVDTNGDDKEMTFGISLSGFHMFTNPMRVFDND